MTEKKREERKPQLFWQLLRQESFFYMARRPYIPNDPSTLFDFELGDVHRLRDWRKI